MGQALAKINNMQLTSMDDLRTVGEVFARSGFFKDAQDMSKAIVKIMAGAELGFGPVASMTGIYIVKERVTLSANLIGAAIKRSGRYNYKVTQHTDQICEIEFFEKGQSIGKSSFSMTDARKAGLADGQTWTKFPRNMLFARALSNGAKWHCADVFGGPVYTPDELGADVAMTEDGEMTVINEPHSPAKLLSLSPAPPPVIEGETVKITAESVRAFAKQKGIDIDASLVKQRKPKLEEMPEASLLKIHGWIEQAPEPNVEAKSEQAQAATGAQQTLTSAQQRIKYFWGELSRLKKGEFKEWENFDKYLETNGIELNVEINLIADIPDQYGDGYARYLANAYDAETTKKDDPLI